MSKLPVVTGQRLIKALHKIGCMLLFFVIKEGRGENK